MHNSKLKYSTEMDTVKYFGDGAFQLLGGYDSSGLTKTLTLIDMRVTNAVEAVVANNIVDYKEKQNYVYLIDDQRRYLLLNIQNNKLSISTELNSFSSEQNKYLRKRFND